MEMHEAVKSVGRLAEGSRAACSYWPENTHILMIQIRQKCLQGGEAGRHEG